MGVSGSGKTRIGKLLQQKISLPFFDGDDFHPPANKEKMKAGIALDDEDRFVWLEELNDLARKHSKLKGAIIACSALKEKYRTVLNNEIPNAVWIFLDGSYETIYKRMNNRELHFMPVSLLQSQFASLEIPVHALRINIEKEPAEIVQIIYTYLTLNI